MKKIVLATLALCWFSFTISPVIGRAEQISVLLIDGQNNHKWQQTTPIIRQTLEACGRFVVEVVTTPSKGGNMDEFDPRFSD